MTESSPLRGHRSQRSLGELAHGGLRDLLHERPLIRQLPPRYLVFEKLPQLGGGDLAVQDHAREWPLPPPLVGHADHRRLDDRGMGYQEVLQLHGGDPLAARLDDVLGPVGQRHVSGVQPAHVAGTQPAVVEPVRGRGPGSTTR